MRIQCRLLAEQTIDFAQAQDIALAVETMDRDTQQTQTERQNEK